MDKLIERYDFQLVEPGCAPGSARYGILINTPNDISPVFPYLNAIWENAWYDHDNEILILRGRDQTLAFRAHEIRVAAGTSDPAEASQTASEVVARVNRAWQERQNITPRFTTRKQPAVIDIFKLLPKTNCKKCGYLTCLAYANALRIGEVQLEQCTSLSQAQFADNRQKVLAILAPE